ncbi:heme exporter protein CcmD [Rhizobium sp. Root482]|jgi:heme exporter protein D|uniref:heme exporter protein CcmD n=1 Tax=Rhizobium sp. Root482 TaxID=1736543 RepID=UPI0009E77372|nr:heme exporter protein CcmD [Rhizobium sp. Root482]
MMSHAAYVFASYAFAAVILAGLVLWVLVDGRNRRRELRALEEAGIRRRSQAGGETK